MTNPMTKSDAARVQSSQAKNGGDMSSAGFAARAQAAGDRNESHGNASGHGKNSGSGADAGSKK
ncbi:Seed maturation protein [Metarhizium album ARSEF 1941]|uniref:Seed maturation protein n=1 Tax=Metarhizium album (strain ARSEF 1941) TaxID=1081103 RepID=A0A0B2WQZ3_METAS|nr:Seed maturation protein [Metarhizium album ARSEF 1941]KHN98481.1 Seed maturation protein [Metarhizium album ARSEF 1941]